MMSFIYLSQCLLSSELMTESLKSCITKDGKEVSSSCTSSSVKVLDSWFTFVGVAESLGLVCSTDCATKT